MKNLMAFVFCASLLIFGGLACRNPLAKYTRQYNCSIAGKPEPQTSDEYVERSKEHIELSGYVNSFDQCAFDAAAEAVRLDPNNAEALAQRGRIYYLRTFDAIAEGNERLRRSSLESALEDLTEAIRLKPDDFGFYYTRSLVYEKSWFLGDTRQKVLDDLTKSAELCKDDCYAGIHKKRGELNLELGNYEAAVEDFTKALKIDSTGREYYQKRAEAYRKLGKNDLADKDDMTFPVEPSNTTGTVKPPAVDVSTPSADAPKTISGGVVNGKATNLVKPAYPAAARAVRAAGAVNVEVTIDEKGVVVGASAVSGHPLLRAAAVQAARESKFSPTLLSGRPVKVKGIVVYNFTP